ncbi:hypothetical protein [Psychrobacter sp. FDAARGOS_221]|uniref:hypothetical protein n=1 Tax=Psychrobacter sp. FDAARGOS_221 TaxID=1975705 RepID=UPI000BB55FB8|nr:hypothetical protein [Psychrobacter sp. FDAARGOS_221]PNK60965.1 hypothetical protein A6J60_008780 [Psychrobacter sp. FDAARGOS_221]
MIRKILAVLITVSLTACTAFTSPTTQRGRDSSLPLLNVDGTSYEQRLDKYANQFVSQDNEEYATVRGYPYAKLASGVFATDPLRVVKVDNQWVKNIPISFNIGHLLNTYRMSITPIKIPTGNHQLLITGTGWENKALYTQLPVINYESGKYYVFKPNFVKGGGSTLEVYEYEPDSRFELDDKDGIVLKSPVSEPVAIGNYDNQKVADVFVK